MSETEQLESQLKQQEKDRRKAEVQRKQESFGTVEHAVEVEFNKVKEKIEGLPKAEKEILIHLNVAENLLPIAQAYDEATRNVLATVTEYNMKLRSKEVKAVVEKLEELTVASNDVLVSLRDIIVRLDRFTVNLELEREMLLIVKKELGYP